MFEKSVFSALLTSEKYLRYITVTSAANIIRFVLIHHNAYPPYYQNNVALRCGPDEIKPRPAIRIRIIGDATDLRRKISTHEIL